MNKKARKTWHAYRLYGVVSISLYLGLAWFALSVLLMMMMMTLMIPMGRVQEIVSNLKLTKD